jgi:oligopeptide transport system substrate-binding protein
MQAMMKQIGVTMELSPAEPKVHYDNLKTKSYDAGNAGWVFDYSDAKNILYLFQSTTLQQNYPGYNNKAFDDFMRQSDKEPDAAKRGALLDAAQAQIMKDIAIAPMFFPYERMIVKPYVQNLVENPRSIFRTRWLSLGPKPKK